MTSEPAAQQSAPAAVPPRVTVVDFDMPFGSMIWFIFKWTLAAIPALFMLVLLASVIFGVLVGGVAGLAGLSQIGQVRDVLTPSEVSMDLAARLREAKGDDANALLLAALRNAGKVCPAVTDRTPDAFGWWTVQCANGKSYTVIPRGDGAQVNDK